VSGTKHMRKDINWRRTGLASKVIVIVILVVAWPVFVVYGWAISRGSGKGKRW
jgi:hypothetical protein